MNNVVGDMDIGTAGQHRGVTVHVIQDECTRVCVCDSYTHMCKHTHSRKKGEEKAED